MTVRPDRSSVGDAAAAAGSIRLPLANRSVARALAILELLGNSDGALSLGEIASREKLPKSSALSLLRALVTTEFCTVGKAQLADRSAPCPALGAPSTDAVDDRLPPSGALDEERREGRARGYAVDDGATATAIRCVAAPLFNDHDCCGAIGVSYLLGERPVESEVSRALLEATRRASERLGGRIGNGRCE